MDRISSGSHDFNKWLEGGYETDVITMIAGQPASGKTNLVILVACSQARQGRKVIFIDTEGGFSVERVKQITGEDSAKILGNILLLQPTDFFEQRKAFNTLVDKAKKENTSLIVVDGMAMHYRLELGAVKNEFASIEDIKKVNRALAWQMKTLAEISRKQKIPIIITNQVYSEFLSEEDRMKGKKPGTNIVGGDLMKYWSKSIIQLKNEGGRRKAVLLKHRSLPEKEMEFEIRNEGVFRRGWL